MDAPSAIRLSVVFVNYNVRHFLEQALLSVRRAAQGLAVEVIVVDNNSVDDSVAMVREKFPEVRLLANKENVGFSRANNQAILQSSGEYVLLLNPDTVVEEDTFCKCLAFMDAHPEAGALGVKMIDGAGKFLPESKRGFPSPFVAFCKTFGLSRLFPRSRVFNRYHLGFLDQNQTNEVDVLAGAFMWLRRAALDKAGLLDEAFFMYGEDIDLSYRITRAGYRNYYFPDTTIIHYKGESTKRASLNYVRVFYQAMIIFARKHFQGGQARAFVGMLQAAIYFRAFLTLANQFGQKMAWPLADAAAMYGGMVLLKHAWAIYRFGDPHYYQASFLYFNAPLYVGFWLLGIFFSGGYDARTAPGKLIRGIFFGTLTIAAVYGFLDMEYRTSRALILLGTAWALGATLFLRAAWHLIRFGNLDISQERVKNLVVVGSQEESERVQGLLHQAQVRRNVVGTVAPSPGNTPGKYLSHLDQLEEVVRIFRVDELIFCSRDIPSGQIMHWMTRLGPNIDYKIVPEEAWSIIGSSSKDRQGELYTIDIRFEIAEPGKRRNKRLLDLLLCLLFILFFPVLIFLVKKPMGLLRNIPDVVLNRKTWVGYCPVGQQQRELPALKPGVLHPAAGLRSGPLSEATLQRLNFLYAKDYSLEEDLRIVIRNVRGLDN